MVRVLASTMLGGLVLTFSTIKDLDFANTLSCLDQPLSATLDQIRMVGVSQHCNAFLDLQANELLKLGLVWAFALGLALIMKQVAPIIRSSAGTFVCCLWVQGLAIVYASSINFAHQTEILTSQLTRSLTAAAIVAACYAILLSPRRTSYVIFSDIVES